MTETELRDTIATLVELLVDLRFSGNPASIERDIRARVEGLRATPKGDLLLAASLRAPAPAETTAAGYKIISDASIPPNEMHAKNEKGETVFKIVDLAPPAPPPIADGVSDEQIVVNMLNARHYGNHSAERRAFNRIVAARDHTQRENAGLREENERLRRSR